MRHIRKALALVLLSPLILMLSLSAKAAESFSPVSQEELSTALVKYRSMTRLKVDFKQKKFLKDMDMALSSEGELEIAPPDRVIYKIERPSKLAVWLGPDEIKIETGSGSGARVQTIKTGSLPGESEKRSLQAMVTWLKLDPRVLAHDYAISKSSGGLFRFEPLKPAESPFESLQMRLSKTGHLTQLIMKEKSGDRIEFTFETPKVSSANR